MSYRAWAYLCSVFGAGVALSAWALLHFTPSLIQWHTFLTLTALATIAHLYEAEAPGRHSYYPSYVFFFAGVLQLAPFLFVLLVITPHVIELSKDRITGKMLRRAWYIQPFNVAMHIIAGFTAHWVYDQLYGNVAPYLTLSPVVAATVAVLVYVVVNNAVLGGALVLARKMSWRESGVLDFENLLSELILLCLGYVVAVLWDLNPWLILPAISPLVLMQRALMVPQLKQEARVDVKTGLWNARHFATLFDAELERARRFDRPLALIVADLDFLRNINNTYGHLAGDAVIAGIGTIIREAIRDYDIAARFGGEEFCIVLPESEGEAATALAERIRSAVAAARFSVATSPTPLQVTMSFGVACFPSDAQTRPDLIHAADVAVYQAKFQGRNCVVRAAAVPRSVTLEHTPVSERSASSHTEPVPAAPVPHTSSSDRAIAPASDDSLANNEDRADGTSHRSTDQGDASGKHPQRPSLPIFWLYIGVVTLAGIGATWRGLAHAPVPELWGLIIFAILALVTQLWKIDLFGKGSFSVAVATVFAAALSLGVPGLIVVNAVITVVDALQRRIKVYKATFNWSVHLLAGLVPVVIHDAVPVPLHVTNLPLLALPILVAALLYYGIEIGLISVARGMIEGKRLSVVWHEYFQWLLGHYLVLALMGLVLAVAYRSLGWGGVAVFVLPILMMRYVQHQYVVRAHASVLEVQRMNQELAVANDQVSGANRSIRQLNRELHQLNDELLMMIAKMIDARDPYVGGHAAKVAEYAVAIGRELDLPDERVELLRQAGFLHDIGKIAIAEHILHKPSRLTEEEYAYIQTHAAVGADLIAASPSLGHLAPFVRHHHERWDGRGYPDGLANVAIPLEARILSVCDSVEAMASDRPYHRGMPLPAIVAEVRRSAGTQFDPLVVDAFVRLVEGEGAALIVNSAHEVDHKQAASPEPPTQRSPSLAIPTSLPGV